MRPETITALTRGVSRASILSMVFKLARSAEQRRLLLRGSELIAKVIAGIQFKDGVGINGGINGVRLD